MLYRGVGRNLKRPFRFFCCTDDASGLDAGVEIIRFRQPRHQTWLAGCAGSN